MKYFTVTVTEQQMWELKSQVSNEITRLEHLLLQKEHKTFRDEIAFQKRLFKTLVNAKIS